MYITTYHFCNSSIDFAESVILRIVGTKNTDFNVFLDKAHLSDVKKKKKKRTD